MKNTITNNGMKLSMIRRIMQIEEGVYTVELQQHLLSFSGDYQYNLHQLYPNWQTSSKLGASYNRRQNCWDIVLK